MSTRGRWVRRLLTLLLVAATAAFLARTVVTNSRELAAFEWRVRPLVLLASVVAHTAVLAWGVFVWSRVARGFGARDASFRALLRVSAYSSAARYIPGGAIWQLLAAARLSPGSGLPQVVALSSMIVHVLLSVATACLVGAMTLPLVRLGLASGLVWPLRVGLPAVALICVHPAVINAGLGLVPRALHRDVLRWEARWVEGVALLALGLATWVLYGAAFFVFLLALTPLPAEALVAAIGVNAVAFAAGWAALFAPGGIGVRESAMTLLLTPLLPAGVAAVVSVGARLWSVAAELALVAVAWRAAGSREG